MARTTIDLDIAIIRKLKHIGANSGESMSRVVNRLLRDALRKRPELSRQNATLRWHTVAGGRPLEGFEPASREYLDLMEDEQ